jgi:uncharacterized membrane protein YccC
MMTTLVRTLRTILRDAAKFDPSGVEVRFAIRCTVCVAIPLVLGSLTGNALAGTSAAYGALVTGFASRQGVYRTRAIGMLLTAFALAISGVAGAVSSPYPIANVILAALGAAAFGLMASVGRASTTASINAVVAFVLFSNPPYDGCNPWLQGAMVFAGGILQTMLLVLVWPLQRFRTERHALATAYHALARYADHVNADDLGLPDAATLAEVRETLADPQPFGSRNELVSYEVLADEAERLRTSLAALTSDHHLLAEVGMPAAAAAIGRIATASSALLDVLADAVDRGIEPTIEPARWEMLARAVRDLEAAAAPGTPSIADARTLAGQLRSSWRAARSASNGGVTAIETVPVGRFDIAIFGDAFATMRANLSLHSAYARHAIRFAVAVAVGIIIQRLLPLAHGQWIVLTVALVLRPDFSSTFTRGFARIYGTIGGAVVASLIAALHPPASAYIALAIVFAGLSYSLFNASYALFSGAITGYVVYLLALGGSPEHASAIDRLEATIIGGFLALVAYLVWPTWARDRVGDDLASLVESLTAYGRLILRAFLAPATVDVAAVQAAELAARLARSNAEASVDQMRGEPVSPRGISLAAAQGVLAACRRIGIAFLALRARISLGENVSRASLAAFVGDFETALASVADTLRHGSVPIALPPLRDDQTVLARAVAAEPDAHWEILVSETDLVVESIDTMADLLRQR